MAALKIKTLTPDQARKAYAQLRGPDGSDAASVASNGQSFAIELQDGGALTFTVKAQNAVLWIGGAVGQAGQGADLTSQGLEFIESIARTAQCDYTAFATARPGLVRKAKRNGYQVAGFILRKKL